MNYTLRACASLVFCLFVVQPLSAAEPVGKVLSAKTTVSSGKRVLQANDGVFFLDRLSTNQTGVGEFMFKDGTKLALGPSASLVVDQFVQKDQSTFRKFSVAATKGTFRWISGSSPSSAYEIKTPMGTMGIRGTAFDVTTLRGQTSVVLLNGRARFCTATTCRVLSRTGDYIRTNGRTISEARDVRSAFKNKQQIGEVFPFLANPGMLSPRFRTAGSDLLNRLAAHETGSTGQKDASEQNKVKEKSQETAGGTGGNTGGGNTGGGNTGGGNTGGGGFGAGAGAGAGGAGAGTGGAGAGSGGASAGAGGGN